MKNIFRAGKTRYALYSLDIYNGRFSIWISTNNVQSPANTELWNIARILHLIDKRMIADKILNCLVNKCAYCGGVGKNERSTLFGSANEIKLLMVL